MEYTLHPGDCLDIMPTLEQQSVDCILADIPYGTTACKWDRVIPFAPMWECIKRVIKPRGAVVLFGSEPFSSLLRVSNMDWYKYDWVWEKTLLTDFLNAKNKPLKAHESISVFSNGTTANKSQNLMQYNPQPTDGKPYRVIDRSDNRSGVWDAGNRSPFEIGRIRESDGSNQFPRSILRFQSKRGFHPTQKPVDLMAYLIRTYTDPGETVLDFTMGSGSTGVAAIQEGRRFVGIEKDAGYFEIAQKRISEATRQPALLEVA